jgi:hypothetical protein
MLVDGTPQQVRFATKCDEHLVEMPRTIRLASRCFRPVGKTLLKIVTLAPDRFLSHGQRHNEQFFDVTQA